MEYIYAKGRAKINLALDVVRKREDGYHDLSTVMQSLALFDKLHIKKVYKPDYLKVISNLAWLPGDERNLAWRAARFLIERFEIKTGIFIDIQKEIPASAGLAGGSADCAAALRGIRDLFELPLSDGELSALSVRFGADVPFCVMEGCAHAVGVGEVMKPLPCLPNMAVLLAKPPVIVSTGNVFARFDFKTARRPDMDRILWAIDRGDLNEICRGMGNALESVTAARHPVIEELKGFMIERGALAAMMTGSGPCVFGVFKERQKALAAGQAVRKAFPKISEIFVTKPYYPNKSNTN